MEPVTATKERERALQFLQQAVALVGVFGGEFDIGHALVCTAQARDRLDDALNELMAAAVLEGQSLRAVAAQAGLAPNSVAARMARSSGLAGYSTDGRVRATDVRQARADKTAPLRFQRRRPTT
ncbi:MAG: hypothetical protein FWC46_01990 [Actinomycetia bacterium]|nr:hypothetical protein [Actinomycetes bacterium]